MNVASYIDRKKRSQDDRCMGLALEAAREARTRGDAARGAVIAFPNLHLSDGETVFTNHDPMGHAEINVLRKACQTLNRPIREAVLYCTTEPCPMCLCAAYEHGIREVVFGVQDSAHGCLSSVRRVNPDHYGVTCVGGVLAEDCYRVAAPSLRENLIQPSYEENTTP